MPALEFDDDDVPRHVLRGGDRVRALGVLHVVPGVDHHAVRRRQQRLLPAEHGRVAVQPQPPVGEDPALLQTNQIQGVVLVVRREVVILQGTASALHHQPLPRERRGDPDGRDRPSDEGASEIDQQNRGAGRHDDGGTGVGSDRDEERRRDPQHGHGREEHDERRHLGRPREDRQTRHRRRGPEARAPGRLEERRPILALAKSEQQSPVQTAPPHPPDAADDRPAEPEQQHVGQRVMVVAAIETQGEQPRESQPREQRRDDGPGPAPRPRMRARHLR